MNNGRAFHQSVAIRMNLFVLGCWVNKSEVYDSTSNKFARLKMHFQVNKDFLMEPSADITVESKVFIFNQDTPLIVTTQTKTHGLKKYTK